MDLFLCKKLLCKGLLKVWPHFLPKRASKELVTQRKVSVATHSKLSIHARSIESTAML